MEKENKEAETQDIVYKKICPYCGTRIVSMYPKQLAFNYGAHTSTCTDNPKNKEEKNGEEN